MHRQLLLIALVVTITACSDNGATSTTSPVTTPSVNAITESFTGTLTLNGSATFPFTSTTSGSMTATLAIFTPDTTLPVGIWMGTWDGASCSSGVAKDKATQSSSVTAYAPAAGTWCVRLYDATGDVTQTETYQIDVTHP